MCVWGEREMQREIIQKGPRNDEQHPDERVLEPHPYEGYTISIISDQPVSACV